MTWEWSHTQEAYDYARENLELLDLDTRIEILAEIRAAQEVTQTTGTPIYDVDSSVGLSDLIGVYERSIRDSMSEDRVDGSPPRMTEEMLNDAIWEFAEEIRRCTNGGWEAHLCPFGCGSHMVYFSDVDEDIVDEIIDHMGHHYKGRDVKETLAKLVGKVEKKLEDNRPAGEQALYEREKNL